MEYGKHFGVTYYSLEHDIEELLKLQVFNRQLDWWRALCKGRLIPYKHDIQFRDLKGWHADLTLSEISDDAQDYKYKIIGENAGMILGDTIKSGNYFSEVSLIKKETRIRDLQFLSSGKIISYFEDIVPVTDRNHLKVKTLTLPFSDKGGKCTHLLSFFKLGA